ncbi:hypothetical protein NKH18_10265 [Streptomyces sp. M10(2022)]
MIVIVRAVEGGGLMRTIHRTTAVTLTCLLAGVALAGCGAVTTAPADAEVGG